MIVPNDVRKGDVINTSDGTTFRVVDNKKGISRQVQTLDKQDRGSAYVFDWYCRLSTGWETGTVPGAAEKIAMPADYLKKASAIGRIISVNTPPTTPVLDPVPVKLGNLRDSWNGAIEISADSGDRTHQYPTDGLMIFDGARINKGDVGRLLRRRQEDRSVSWESARRIWLDNIDNATSLITETGPAEPGKDGRPVTMLHDTGKFLCVYVDASRFTLANKAGKVHSWRAADATSGIVGRDRDGLPTVVLMPIRRAT